MASGDRPGSNPESEDLRAVRVRRLQWSSRRGLLELDLFLDDFARRVLPTLADEQLDLYEQLMFEDDSDLLEWLHDRAEAPEASLRSIVGVIRQERLKRTPD